MIPLRVILELADGEVAQYLTPGQYPNEMAAFEMIGCLPRGMESGLPSFLAVIAMPDGQRIVAETSWKNMSLGAVALIGRWGTP
jgi:hypothetical protein